MVLTRSMGKPLNTQATLLHGKVQLVELALRTAAGNGGVLNISHRVPFDDLARRTPGAVLSFVPPTPMEHGAYAEYIKYFGSKVRAGVARLDDVDALYIVPPCPEAAGLLKSLEASGATGLPTNALLGVIAATPGPTTAAAAGQQAARTAAPKAPTGGTAPAPAQPQDAAKPEAPAAPAGTPNVKADAKADAKAEAAAKPEPTLGQAARADEAKAKQADGDDNGPEMSKEALLDLFSNPDLIKSLQNLEETPGD